jgi:hypothetical protein
MMTMADYVDEIRHAVSTVIPTLWEDKPEMDNLHREVHRLEQVVYAGYRQAEAISLDAETPDDVMLGVGAHWETYFGPDKELNKTVDSFIAVRARFEVRRFSVYSLAGNLLQYGKQGLSMVHGGLPTPRTGRAIGSQALSEVVWQARNQALHWEEGNPHPPVVKCFQTLDADFGNARFADSAKRSLAFDVVELLGWTTAADFESDMLTMG